MSDAMFSDRAVQKKKEKKERDTKTNNGVTSRLSVSERRRDLGGNRFKKRKYGLPAYPLRRKDLRKRD